MITVHHLENSRSQRVLWLLEELGAEYEVKRYERTKRGVAPDELMKVHPLGKSPVITHDGETIAESAVIIEYLLDTFGDGAFRPERNSAEYRRYSYWMHFAEGSAMCPLVMKLIFKKLENVGPPIVKQIIRGVSKKVQDSYVDKELKIRADFIEAELGKGEWFVGNDFTAADVQMSYVVEANLARGGAKKQYPRMVEFLEKIRGREAYGRALERGGPYSVIP